MYSTWPIPAVHSLGLGSAANPFTPSRELSLFTDMLLPALQGSCGARSAPLIKSSLTDMLPGKSWHSSSVYNCELVLHYHCPFSQCNCPKVWVYVQTTAAEQPCNEIWGYLHAWCCQGPAPRQLPGGHCCVVSPQFFVAPFSGELLCTGGGVGVWVFECCCLLFLKGLLALPWGYCSRNSYLCYSPAYRLLTGTKWKNPAHNVLCFVNMFYCPWFSAICYSIFIFYFFLHLYLHCLASHVVL